MGADFGDDPANSENEKPNMYKVERLNFCLKRERREFFVCRGSYEEFLCCFWNTVQAANILTFC